MFIFRFEINFWPHHRRPTDEEMKDNVKGVFGIICSAWMVIDEEIIDAAGNIVI